MKIDDQLIKYTAKLAQLDPEFEDTDQLKEDFGKILSYMDTLNQLDTEGVAPLSHSTDIQNVLREDTVQPSWDRAPLLANAPEQKDGCFKVPKVVE